MRRGISVVALVCALGCGDDSGQGGSDSGGTSGGSQTSTGNGSPTGNGSDPTNSSTGTNGSSGSSGAGSNGAGSNGAGSNGAGTSGSGSNGSGSNGATDEHQGIGAPCDTDSDCNDGLICNIDTEDYIAHRQCTVPCAAPEECEAQFGELTMCIGANLCVARCLTDDDCPELTRCTSNNWCERSGPESGNPYCAGTPTPCSVMTESECRSALGCNYEGDCSGVASSCFSQFDSFSCTTQEGCYWSSSTNDCSGSATSCSLMSFEFECQDQDGCRWSADCTGLPLATSCEAEPPSLCEFTVGCQLVFP